MRSRGTWVEDRHRETEFRNRVPSVLIIGAGHIGLEVAARLKHLGVPTLVVEKNKRVGDNVCHIHGSPSVSLSYIAYFQWRNRYNSLCLHDPVCKFSEHSFFDTLLKQHPRVQHDADHAVRIEGGKFSFRSLLNILTGSQLLGLFTHPRLRFEYTHLLA
jgi:hypothetical protein